MLSLLKDKYVYLFVGVLFFRFSKLFPESITYWGFIILLFLLYFFFMNERNKLKPIYKKSILFYSVPYIIGFVYSIPNFLLNDNSINYLMRGASNMLSLVAVILFCLGLASKYKEKCTDFLFVSASISYVLMTLSGISQFGIIYILQMAMNVSEERFEWSDESGLFDEIFELHEFGLAMPLIALYYFWSNKKWKDKLVPIIISLLISLLCAKRIAIAGFVVVSFISVLMYLKTLQRVINRTFSFILMFVVFGYLYFLYSGLYLELARDFDIDMKGRDSFYSFFISKSDYTLTYLGYGMGYVNRYLQDYSPFGPIMGLHNDILRIYVELGMVGSFIFYYLMFVKNYFVHSSIDIRYGTYFCLCTLYCVFTYFTDNTIYYYIIQMANALVPFSTYLSFSHPLKNNILKVNL